MFYVFSLPLVLCFFDSPGYLGEAAQYFVVLYLVDAAFLFDLAYSYVKRRNLQISAFVIHPDNTDCIELTTPADDGITIPLFEVNSATAHDSREEHVLKKPDIKLCTDINRLNSNDECSAKGGMVGNRSKWIVSLITVAEAAPLEVVAYAAGYEQYYLLLLLRLVRLVRFNVYWKGFIETWNPSTNASARRALLIALLMLCYGHIGGCVYYAFALSLFRGGQETWVSSVDAGNFDEALVGRSGDGTTLYLQPLGLRYLRSLYLAVQTMETVGFGDLVPKTMAETVFCVFFFYGSWFLVQVGLRLTPYNSLYYIILYTYPANSPPSVCLFCLFFLSPPIVSRLATHLFLINTFILQVAIANLVLAVNSLDSVRTVYERRMSNLVGYAARRRLPQELADRIRAYYEYNWSQLAGVSEERLVAELPRNVAVRLQQEQAARLLRHIRILAPLSPQALAAVAAQTRFIVFSPGDVVVPQGSLCKGLLVLAKGSAAVTLSNPPGEAAAAAADVAAGDTADAKGSPALASRLTGSAPEVLIQQGQVFGEEALLRPLKASAKVVARSFCEFLFLSARRFRHIARGTLTVDAYAELEREFVESRVPGQVRRTFAQKAKYLGLADRALFQGRLPRASGMVGDIGDLSAGNTGAAAVVASSASQGEIGSVICSTSFGEGGKPGLVRSVSKFHWDHGPPQSRWQQVVVPNSRFRMVWGLCLFAGVLFYLVSIPLLVSRMFEEDLVREMRTLLGSQYLNIDFHPFIHPSFPTILSLDLFP
jgi:CRP-like cAMP-binding protein